MTFQNHRQDLSDEQEKVCLDAQ